MKSKKTKTKKGLTDSELKKKYESGKINLKKVLQKVASTKTKKTK
jgi:hypothetical protein